MCLPGETYSKRNALVCLALVYDWKQLLHYVVAVFILQTL